jgi:hypothetical protein
MWIEFFSRKLVIVLMMVISGMGVILRAMAGVRCKKLCRQSEDLTLAGDRSLKQLRVRYESAYRLNHGQVHAGVLVRHHMSGYRMMGMPIGRLECADRAAALCCLLLAVCGFGVLFTGQQDIAVCARVFFWGVGLAVADVLFGMLAGFHNVAGLCGNLTDYLEHTLSARLFMEQEQRNSAVARPGMRDDLFMKKEEQAEETGLEIYQSPAAQIAATFEKEEPRSTAHAEGGRRLSERDEQIIADVLREYLGGKYS